MLHSSAQSMLHPFKTRDLEKVSLQCRFCVSADVCLKSILLSKTCLIHPTSQSFSPLYAISVKTICLVIMNSHTLCAVTPILLWSFNLLPVPSASCSTQGHLALQSHLCTAQVGCKSETALALLRKFSFQVQAENGVTHWLWTLVGCMALKTKRDPQHSLTWHPV